MHQNQLPNFVANSNLTDMCIKKLLQMSDNTAGKDI